MASINNLVSYELNGVKESFANWISNLSPVDTPFVSMTGKEAVKNKFFQWQEDQLGKFGANAVAEGSDADSAKLTPTTVKHNVTQILRKVVQVSDTANALASFGRGKEMQYQLEKAGKEIKRDLEYAFLNQDVAQDGVPPGIPTTAALVRKFAGFRGLVAALNAVSPEDAGAIVHQSGTLTEDNLFKVTEGLYLAGACPDIIMFHPKHAAFFSGLMENTAGTRVRMFDGASDTKVNKYVSTLVDPLGCTFKLVPNRFMPEDFVYFFRASDWTQMVLRTPHTQLLAKTGSFDKYMIEMEVGLRHRNQFASGILDITTPPVPSIAPVAPQAVTLAAAPATTTVQPTTLFTFGGGVGENDFTYALAAPVTGVAINATTGVVTIQPSATAGFSVVATGKAPNTALTATAQVTSLTKPAATSITATPNSLALSVATDTAAGKTSTIAVVPSNAAAGTYTIKTQPVAAQATATIAGNVVTVKPVAAGAATSVVITDGTHDVTIAITVAA